MRYTDEDISEMQGMMRGAADPAAQVEILAQIYGGTADGICIALGIPLLPIELTPSMVRHGWTVETIVTIREMFRIGKCQREIAAAVGLSEHAIYGFFSRHRGIFPEKYSKCENPKRYKYKKITPKDIERIRGLFREGWNITDIALEIGCSRPKVYKVLFGEKTNAASNGDTSLTAEISV